jgi:hypothetical protein
MTADIHTLRPGNGVNAATMVQTALMALGRVEERVSLTQELRHHLAIARSGRAIIDELYEQMRLTGARDLTPTQDAAWQAAEDAEQSAQAAIIALFSGLTPQERRQLGGIL